MNVFVLSTGRCGSKTFARACSHITNYTSAHESRIIKLGAKRLDYPDDHIEVDNRLAWFLGPLGQRYGEEAFYVHLMRDTESVARSYFKRWHLEESIVKAFSYAILTRKERSREVCRHYCETIDSNIRYFLRDKPGKMEFSLGSSLSDFRRFWTAVGAEGDLEAACAEWNVRHNRSPRSGIGSAVLHKAGRVLRGLPRFLRDA